jgi:hypothetical protein
MSCQLLSLPGRYSTRLDRFGSMGPNSIIMQVPHASSALATKRIFHKSGVHNLAYSVRFHCRDNPLKGDRRAGQAASARYRRSIVAFEILENSQWC